MTFLFGFIILFTFEFLIVDFCSSIFQLSVAFHKETIHLICKGNQRANKLLVSILNTTLGCNGVITQPIITCSKLEIETLEQGVKYLQS